MHSFSGLGVLASITVCSSGLPEIKGKASWQQMYDTKYLTKQAVHIYFK